MIKAKLFAVSLSVSSVVWAGCEEDCLTDWLQHHHGHGGGHHPGATDDAGEGVPCDASLQTGDAGTDASFPIADSGTDGDAPVACAPDQFESGGACVHKATSVSVGFVYTCAILEGGSLKCWGSGSTGVLGYGPPFANLGDQPNELGSSLSAVALGAGLTATRVFASNDLTCAVLNPGSTKCWGYDGYKATGAPGPFVNGVPPDQLPEQTFGALHAVAVTAGAGFGSALLDDGSVTSWGSSGIDFGGGAALSFDRPAIYDNWHTCAVLSGGAVVCGGVGGSLSSGALGHLAASSDDPLEAVALGTGRTATAVATGTHFTCALLDDQSVKCWGTNARGQLGQGDTTARGVSAASMGDALLPVPLGQAAIAIAAGVAHACAIRVDGSVVCWGANDSGQLGIGSTTDMGDQPGEMAALTGVELGSGRTAVSLEAGGHTCVVLDNGGIKCWGGNALGQLGQGDTVTRGTAPGQLGTALPEIDLGP